MAGSFFLPCCLWTARDEDGEVYTKTEPPSAAEEISGAFREEKGAKDTEHLLSKEEQDSVRQCGGDNTGIPRHTTTRKSDQNVESGDNLSEEEVQETRITKEADKDEGEPNQRKQEDCERKQEQGESKDLSDPPMNVWTTQESDQNEDPSRKGDTAPTLEFDKRDPSLEGDQRGAAPGPDQLCSVDDTVGTKDQPAPEIVQHYGSVDLKEVQVSGSPSGSDQHDTVEHTGSKRGSIGSSGSEGPSGGEFTVNETGPQEAVVSLLKNENTLKETEINAEANESAPQEHEIILQENEITHQENETSQRNETTRHEQDTTPTLNETTRQEDETTLQNETTPQEQEITTRETDTQQEFCQHDGSEDPAEVDGSPLADITADLIQDPENRDLPSDREIPITIPGQECENQVSSDDTANVQGPSGIETTRDFDGHSESEDAPRDKKQEDAEATQEYVEQVLSELEHAADDFDVDDDVSETLQFPDEETQQLPPDKRLDTALHDACRRGDLQQVTDILSEGQLDINCRGRGGQTPVMTAVRKEHKQVFDCLVDEGADLSLNADDGNNVLHYACRGGQVEMVKAILAKNIVDINSRGQGGRTAILWAAGWGRAAIFEILAQEGADLTAEKDGGNNILHVACHGGDMVIVKYVLSQDVVDLSARNNDGQTAAMISKRRGHYPITKLLASRGCPMK